MVGILMKKSIASWITVSLPIKRKARECEFRLVMGKVLLADYILNRCYRYTIRSCRH